MKKNDIAARNMERRSFNKIIVKGTIMSSMVQGVSSSYKRKNKPLKRGDKVGLITPAGIITEERLIKTKANLDALGLKYHHTQNVLLKEGYLAGADAIRLKELHEMYADESIDAIWCIRGGYGTTRILDHIDFDLIKSNRKPLIGYSDITALLNTIHQKTGSPCFHGPVASSTMTPFTTANLAPIFGLDETHIISNSTMNIAKGLEEDVFKFRTITSGKAEGELVGGNLSLLVSLLGTDHEVKTKNKIVFIEDIGEAPYRIDRMLTQLISAGFFKKVKGIVLGIFAGCERKDYEKQTLQQVVHERVKRLQIPAMYGFSFGHIDDQCTFPIGAKAEMDADLGTVTLLEDGY